MCPQKISAFLWIPGILKWAMESISNAFTLHKKKPTVGFHVSKGEPDEFVVQCYIYPPPEHGSFSVRIDTILDVFNSEDLDVVFDRTISTHGCLKFSGKIGKLLVCLHLFLDRHKEGFHSWPPLLFDTFTKEWCEREVHPEDSIHGDETKTFFYWFFKQCPIAKEIQSLCNDKCCREALIESYDAFNRHIRDAHVPDEITLDMINRAHKAWQESMKRS